MIELDCYVGFVPLVRTLFLLLSPPPTPRFFPLGAPENEQCERDTFWLMDANLV